ncbi:orotidine-5'-phosphate decarboxylase [Microbacterium sp. PMB16]|uniref:orotidine-5'-phosphate decarboxylase n=1 Tax=Microbacterium sp. PMB16 TaxID=3120157 RepID=UPI003F4BF531
MTQSFGERLRGALRAHGPLCVGIDPHAALLDSWSLPQTADGVRSFGLRVVEAAAEQVGVVKPQVSFFERFGSRGYAALEDLLAAARAAGLLIIADAKRGDLDTTMAAYGEAWFAPGSPLEADALTVSPILGPDSLRDVLARAIAAGKGAFVLGATSNPDGEIVQRALTVDAGAGENESVARRVAREVAALDTGERDGDALGSIGLVIGATIDRSRFGLDDAVLASMPILAPGFGAQGAEPADLITRFGALSGNVLASESRSILSAGPSGIADRIGQRAALYQEIHGG